METVKLDVKIVEPASRAELFIRFIWGLIGYIVLYVLNIVNMILIVIQWFIILVTGKRNLSIANLSKRIFNFMVQWWAYIFLLTDERNPLLPE